MLRYLFPRLTANPARGAELFGWAVGEARAPHWYVAGEVPDTVDGRFAVLATVIALAMVRLEREGEPGDSASVAVTERFIEAMEAEHREMGLGDPRLGRTVRKLVASLARRVELWRAAAPQGSWTDAARTSIYAGDAPSEPALAHSASTLRALSRRLDAAALLNLVEGKIG